MYLYILVVTCFIKYRTRTLVFTIKPIILQRVQEYSTKCHG